MVCNNLGSNSFYQSHLLLLTMVVPDGVIVLLFDIIDQFGLCCTRKTPRRKDRTCYLGWPIQGRYICFKNIHGLGRVHNSKDRGRLDWSGHGTTWRFGAVFHISQYPEKLVVGKLDYLWNSHNILHILSSICPILLHFGTVIDVEWMETAKCL